MQFSASRLDSIQGFNSGCENLSEGIFAEFAGRVACAQYALVELTVESFGRQSKQPISVVLRRGNIESDILTQLVDSRAEAIAEIACDTDLSKLVFADSLSGDAWNVVLDSDRRSNATHQRLALFSQAGHEKIICLICAFGPSGLHSDTIKNFHHYGLNLLSGINSESTDEDLFRLSQGEYQALVWCAKGKTSFEISKILTLSEHTINHYLNSAVRKLGASNRPHAVSKAILYGVISLRDLT